MLNRLFNAVVAKAQRYVLQRTDWFDRKVHSPRTMNHDVISSPAGGNAPSRRQLLSTPACVTAPFALAACSSGDAKQSTASALRRLRVPTSSIAICQTQDLVRYATLVPSSQNTQCWHFHIAEAAIVISPGFARSCLAVGRASCHGERAEVRRRGQGRADERRGLCRGTHGLNSFRYRLGASRRQWPVLLRHGQRGAASLAGPPFDGSVLHAEVLERLLRAADAQCGRYRGVRLRAQRPADAPARAGGAGQTA